MARRSEAQTVQLAVRMKEPLRAEIERAARQRGVSINAETIRRLEQSFEQDRRIEDVFGSPELFGLARAIASVMAQAGTQAAWLAGRPADGMRAWLSDPQAYDQAARGAVRVLEALRPEGEIEPAGDRVREELRSSAGARVAQDMLTGLRINVDRQEHERLRDDLAPLLERLHTGDKK